MQLRTFFSKVMDKRFQVIAGLIILLGIVFRLVMFFQNRNLIIDEANVVRNIYERGFMDLLKPLSYEQYAPPVYLWILEGFSYIFGYSEQAMRLEALLCGIGALFVFWWFLRRIMPASSLWLPLGLFCFAPIVIKYSAEVKQYGPDAFIAISLACIALKMDFLKMARSRFVVGWIIVGSLAIWSSQPSVFILASIGFYYFIPCVQQKKWHLIPALLLIGVVWLAQFGIYYELILKSQINSDYLQNYHRDYFLFATPTSAEEWRHNWMRLEEILHNTAGYNTYSFCGAIFFIVLGAFALLRKSLALFALIAFPVLFTLVAAALNQFSLIERVIVFILPFTMTLLGYGFAQLMLVQFRLLQVALFLFGAHVLWAYNFKSLFREKFNFQELTVGLDYIVSKNGTGKELYVDCASRDTYIYYTDIHPDKSKYATLRGAYLFGWSEDDFPQVAAAIPTSRSFFIFTGGSPDQRKRHLDEVQQSLVCIDSFEFVYCYVYTFKKK